MSESGIFKAAVKLPPERRAAYLDQACGSDSALRAEIESLLHAHDATGGFLGDVPAGPDPTEDYQPIAERPGTVIGPYKLMEQIGEGGFGLVFVAEQQHPLRRRVALKIIKPGMDSREIIARFEAERQALALMDHVHIARVFDAGTTASCRPYFVMELVKGIPIVDYSDQQQLTTRDRLELFLSVCQAVQHAHSKGIIHRDLKPSNILVAPHDGVPVVKVIDFGIAKAIGQQLTDKTIYTRFAQMIGTPLYMSPEQAEINALDVDIRSDVYSLGVLLYELLTGTTPFDRQRFATADYEEIRRIIREEEPPKPSTRLSTLGAALATVSAQRRTDSTKLSALVKGDLDWIVMKALEKERSRRYETASALAADLRRFLNQEPIEARPPSTWYRLGKLARRHNLALTTAAVVVAAMVLGTAVSTWQAVRAIRAEGLANDEAKRAIGAEQQTRAQRDRALNAEAQARAEADKSKAINDFLTEDLLTQAEPAHTAAEDHVTLLEVLDRAAAKVGDRFARQPEVEDVLRRTIAATYHGLGSWEKAERQWRAVLEAARRRLGGDSAPALEAAAELAHILGHRGRSDAEVLELGRSAAEGLARALGPDHPDTLATRNNLALAYHAAGRTAEAIALHEGILKLRESKLGPDHPDTLSSRTNLAAAYRAAGRTAEAIALHESTLKLKESKLGPDHPDTLISRTNLATAYHAAGRTAEAIALHESTLKLKESKLGPDHPDTLISRTNLATAYHAAGRTAEAIALHESTLKLKESKLGPDHPDTLISRTNLAAAYWRAGRLDRSIPLFESTLKQNIAQLGPDHPETLRTRANLGVNYRDAGRPEEGARLMEEALELARGRPAAMNALSWVPMELAAAYEATGQLAKAEPNYRQGLEQARNTSGPADPRTAAVMAQLGTNLLKQARWSEAEPVLRECLAIREKAIPDDWRRYDTMSQLGGALLVQARHAEAEPLIVQGYQGMNAREARIPATGKFRLSEAAERVVRLYEALGKREEARAWKAKLGLTDLPADVFAQP